MVCKIFNRQTRKLRNGINYKTNGVQIEKITKEKYYYKILLEKITKIQSIFNSLASSMQ